MASRICCWPKNPDAPAALTPSSNGEGKGGAPPRAPPEVFRPGGERWSETRAVLDDDEMIHLTRTRGWQTESAVAVSDQ